jgi:UDP-glucose 4-epimerase
VIAPMRSRRVLITGLSTYWGGRLARALEDDPAIDVIIGVDTDDPTVELERTEFVRVSNQHALIRRIVGAAEIDTVIDSRLAVDSIWTSPRAAHENNVIGTMNILAACGGADSPVRKFVFKSSAHYYGCERDDPAFFTEGMERPHAPRTPIERDIVEAESGVADFARRNPDVTVTVLRFANALGAGVRTSHLRLFSLPVVPTILGFDPRYQFIHEDDIVGALEFAARDEVPGIYNAAGDGVLALSEVLDLLGKPMAPVLPPWGTGLLAGPLNRVGLRIPVEMLNQLRYGRGIDNRRLKAAGYRFRYTTREAVIKQREHMRLRPLLRGARAPYRYEQEVEEFLRWSPSVRRSGADAGKAWRPSPRQVHELQRALAALGERPAETGEAHGAGGATGPVTEYEALEAVEVITILPSLPEDDLRALRRHEAAGARRSEVIEAIDRLLAPSRSPGV